MLLSSRPRWSSSPSTWVQEHPGCGSYVCPRNILPKSRGQPCTHTHTQPPTRAEGVSLPWLSLRETKMLLASAPPFLPHAAPQSSGPRGDGCPGPAPQPLPWGWSWGQSPEVGWQWVQAALWPLWAGLAHTLASPPAPWRNPTVPGAAGHLSPGGTPHMAVLWGAHRFQSPIGPGFGGGVPGRTLEARGHTGCSMGAGRAGGLGVPG